METSLIFRLSIALLRVVARVVPVRDRAAWQQEWEAELEARRRRLVARHALTQRQEMHMLGRVLGSINDAAWLRRQFTRDADLVHDLRYGVRLLRRNPLFSMLTVTVLALGVGASVGIFSVLDALMFRPLPYRDADRIVVVFEAESLKKAELDEVAPGTFLDWQAQIRSLETIAALDPASFTYAEGEEPQVLPGHTVTAGFFETFAVKPLYGRTFAPEEFQRGRDQVVVLSYAVWSQFFGGDPAVVGRVVRLNGRPLTVIGVMPRTFAPRLQAAAAERGVWAPKIVMEYERDIRGSRYFTVVGRLKPGVTREQAQAEFDNVSRRLAEEHPRTNRGWTAQPVTLRDHLAGHLRPALGLLLGGVALLLVVAAANTANLLIACNTQRSAEVAIRSAIGAARIRLLRQFAAETCLLGGLGCVLGLGIAHLVIQLVASLGPADVPALRTLSLDLRALLFAAGLAMTTTLIVGILPAWRLANGDLLRSAARGRADASTPQRLRAVLVVGELAVALMLLAGAGLLLRSFGKLIETSPGFSDERVAVLQIFSRPRARNREQLALYIQQIDDRMRQLAGVESVGAVSAMPFIESNIGMKSSLSIEGRAAPREDESDAFITIATPGYFPTMRIPLLEGRMFDERDRDTTAPVAVVTETLARRQWPNGTAVGRKVTYQLEGVQRQAEIVGIVGAVKHDGLDQPARAELVVPHSQVPYGGMTFVVRTTGDPAASIRALRAQIHAVDRTQAINRAATVGELISRSLADRRFTLALFVTFAALATLLAAAGVYGVISVLTAQRTREFGVRLALGAGRLEIVAMVLRQVSAIAVGGLAIGLAAALAIGRVMNRFLYEVTPWDPTTLVAVLSVLAALSLVACILPAHRATRVDPLIALRSD